MAAAVMGSRMHILLDLAKAVRHRGMITAQFLADGCDVCCRKRPAQIHYDLTRLTR